MDPYVREREVVHEPVERDRVIVTDDRPRGVGGLVATIVGVVVVLLVAWFLLNALGILGDAAEDGVEVNVPDASVETNE